MVFKDIFKNICWKINFSYIFFSFLCKKKKKKGGEREKKVSPVLDFYRAQSEMSRFKGKIENA